ncbi:MAG: hypothetical protein M1838_002602 [Thelocarpon superellum]|nr:MAG: hypothetical protein M1838_002602 [Thelocarpon superellum]
MAKEGMSLVSTEKRLPVLPPEILLEVLMFCDVRTFHLATLSSVAIWRLAMTSPALLLHHLSHLPSHRRPLGPSSPVEKIRQRWKHAAKKALLGSGILADVVQFDPGLLHRIKVKQSVFTPGQPASLMVVCHFEPFIRLYALDSRGPRLHTIFTPRVNGHGAVDQSARTLRLLKTAICHNHYVAALYESQQDGVRPVTEMHLLTFTPPDLTGAQEYSHRFPDDQCEAWPDLTNARVPGYHPASLAVNDEGTVALLWQSSMAASLILKIYRRFDLGWETVMRLVRTVNLTPPDYRQIDMDFEPTGKSLIFSQPGTLLHDFWITYPPAEGDGAAVLFDSRLRWLGPHDLDLYIGMPFMTRHYDDRNLDMDTCVERYRALALDLQTGEVYLVGSLDERPVAECDHGHEEARHRYLTEPGRWDVLMKLDGTSRALSSIGHSAAIAPDYTRIAIANWTEVLVWVIDPNLLYYERPFINMVFPKEQIDENSLIHIQPHRLPIQGVVHRMCFPAPNQLFALSDRGVVSWDLRPGCSKRSWIGRIPWEYKDNLTEGYLETDQAKASSERVQSCSELSDEATVQASSA